MDVSYVTFDLPHDTLTYFICSIDVYLAEYTFITFICKMFWSAAPGYFHEETTLRVLKHSMFSFRKMQRT